MSKRAHNYAAVAVLLGLIAFIGLSQTAGPWAALMICVAAPFLLFLVIGLLFSPGTLRLEEGEAVVTVQRPSGPPVWLYYGLSLGLYAYWRAAKQLAVTDRRVIYQDGLIQKTERSLPLHFIQDASVRSMLWWGHVSLSTAGGPTGLETFGPCWTEEARAMKDTIVDRARRSRQAPASTPSNDDMVLQLQSLQQLHQTGALNADEFAAAKGRLLSA